MNLGYVLAARARDTGDHATMVRARDCFAEAARNTAAPVLHRIRGYREAANVTAAAGGTPQEALGQVQAQVRQRQELDGHAAPLTAAEVRRHGNQGALKGHHSDAAALIRAIHTLKGNCGMYGVTSVATVCHDLESKLMDGGRGCGLERSGSTAE